MKLWKKLLIVSGVLLCIAAVWFPVFWSRYGYSVTMHLRYDPKPKQPMPVLMYHNIVADNETCNDMMVTVSRMKEDIEYILAQGYTPVLPSQLVDGGELPEKPIMLTFDDGYWTCHRLLLPILQEYNVKAVLSMIVMMPDLPASDFCSWRMLREMQASGLVEIGSHSYALHNLGGRGGVYSEDGVNGICRIPGESDGDFKERVLDDIQLSYDRISAELGTAPLCFAYPYGQVEPDAEELINELFPVTLITWPATADLHDGTRLLPRYTVTMDTPLSEILK